MKRIVMVLGVLALLALLAMAGGCTQWLEPPVVVPNQLPVIGFGALHSPNGEQAHAPFEWDVYGVGYDPDGEIVQWIIRLGGVTYRVGAGDAELERSEVIVHQFPGAGWYVLRITAIDDDGGVTEWMPSGTNGLWYIGS